MKKIEKEFTRSGFVHKLVKRRGQVAIYKRRGIKSESGDYHYEVVKISSHNGYKLGGQYIESAETYPGASLWGLQGWTYQDLDIALKQFEVTYKRFNKKKKEVVALP